MEPRTRLVTLAERARQGEISGANRVPCIVSSQPLGHGAGATAIGSPVSVCRLPGLGLGEGESDSKLADAVAVAIHIGDGQEDGGGNAPC
jgi:hypothetical protein